MMTSLLRPRRIVGVVSLALAACGGAAPTHTGYPDGEKAPWEKASKLALNDNLEATADGDLSFPGRQRAKWYVVDLPAPGKLTARLSTEPTAKGTDVALELLDAGFNVVAAGENDDDVGQPKKVREVKDARQGKAYVHLYTLGRSDAAGYTVRLKLEPRATIRSEAPAPSEPAAITQDRTKFPWTVPFLPALPQIKGGGGGAVAQPSTPTTPPTTPPATPPTNEKRIRATVSEFANTGNGVRLILNKGRNAGLDDGMEGDLLAGGKPLPGAHFKLKNCKDNECEAVVKATMDQVQANRTVSVKVQ